MTPIDPNQKDPKDWTPEDALAVNAVPDEVRLHADPSETEIAQRSDGVVVDPEADTASVDDVDPEDAVE